MFSYNEANGSESKTTRMFRPVGQVAAPRAKFAVSDCILTGVLVTVNDLEQSFVSNMTMFVVLQ